MEIKQDLQQIRQSYFLLTQEETYKDCSFEELHDLFLEDLQKMHIKFGGGGQSYPTKLNMTKKQLIESSIQYHKILLDAIDKQLF
jgi:hypothetical protein